MAVKCSIGEISHFPPPPRACRAAVTKVNQQRNSINSDNLKVPANQNDEHYSLFY